MNYNDYKSYKTFFNESSKVTGSIDKQLSLTEFRHTLNEARAKAKDAKRSMDEATKNAIAEYSKQRASEIIEQEKSKYDDLINDTKEKMLAKLDTIISAKKDKLREYTTAAPTQEQLSLLTALNLRGGNVSETEMRMLVTSCVGNYQALATAKSICERSGMTFVMPFDPAESEKELETLSGQIKGIIGEIGLDDISYLAFELLEYDENTAKRGYFISQFEKFDYNRETANTVPELTTMQKLNGAMETARLEYQSAETPEEKAAAMKKSIKLIQLEKEYGNDLMTDTDRMTEAAVRKANAESELSAIVGDE